jgi:predicted AAA+ superfamily ATPase
MNIIHGMNDLQKLLPRALEPVVRRALARAPVVVLTGARQTGKSTLVTTDAIGRGRSYRTLDDFDLLERAQREPEALAGGGEPMTLDEVQRAPELLRAIKRAVDRKRCAGQFLLTGSANLLMMRRTSETLAGRAVHLVLWPLSEHEKHGWAHPVPWDRVAKARSAAAAVELLRAMPAGRPRLSDHPRGATGLRLLRRALAGGYPVAALASSSEERSQWFDGYIRTYLERDLQDVASISNLADFRRLMRLAALRVGQVLNQTDLGRDAGLTQPTTHRYLNLLETSYQIVRLPTFALNRGKRLVKARKLYWTDTGLAGHLAGVSDRADDGSEAAVVEDSLAGPLLENLVLVQLLTWQETVSPRPGLYYWRAHSGHEVDFVIEAGRRLLPIEVKTGSRVRLADLEGLGVFLDQYPREAPFGIVLYGGAALEQVTDRVLSVPLDLVMAGGPA